MDSSPALETVYQAVYSLFNNPVSGEKEKASQWLGQLQKSVYAWKLSDEMLQQKRDLESCYFAAQTMRSKIQTSFNELPIEAHSSLRDSLMAHILQINENTNKAIVIQLCLALADLALQMMSWKQPVKDLIDKYGSNPSNLWPLLEILKALPEEVGSPSLRLGSNRRKMFEIYLIANGLVVADFLQVCIQNNVNNPTICKRILSCYTSWICIQGIPFENTECSEVVAYAIEILNNPTQTASLHEKAADCICMILQALDEDCKARVDIAGEEPFSNRTQMKHMHVYSYITAFEQPYHLAVAHEDLEKCTNYCRIFTELAETLLEMMVVKSSPTEQYYSIKVLDLVLVCVGHHDYEVAQITFNLWYRLSELLYQRNSDQLNSVFKPHIERLIGILCRHCQMEPDNLGLVEEASGDQEFADFRNRVSELIKDVVFIVGSSHCFRQMFDNLVGGHNAHGQPIPAPTWDSTEASLFVMQAVAKNILPEENDVVPKVVEAILILPENTHIAVKHTSILLLGELCEWIDKHPEYLATILRTLEKCLTQRGLGSAALIALQNICTACPIHMQTHFGGLVQIVCNLENFTISNEAAISVLKGVAKILSKLPHNEIERVMKQLCGEQVKSLQHIMDNPGVSLERGTKTDPVVWLDRLSAILRYTSVDLDDSQNMHPCQSVIDEIWPILSMVCTRYQQDFKIMEHCCRCLRFAIRCVGRYSSSLLRPLVEQIVQLYGAYPHSCFLYLGSVLVDEYGSDANNVPGLLNMLEAFLGPTFLILQEANGLENHPDTVDDLFRLCYRLLQRAAVPFLHSNVMSNIFECGLMACRFEHKDANTSVMKFFFDLVHYSDRNSENQPDFAIRKQLVEQIVQERGQSLVTTLLHAAVFTMSTYMLPDIADILLEIASMNKAHFSKWLEEAIKSLQGQNSGAAVSVTPEQLQEFHSTITSTNSTKTVNTALRRFARLYH